MRAKARKYGREWSGRLLVAALCAAAPGLTSSAPAGDAVEITLTLTAPPCRDALSREAFLSWLKAAPASRWLPAQLLRAARRGDAEAAQALASLKSMASVAIDPFTRDAPRDEALPLRWLDFSGDGRCDVIARLYEGRGNRDLDAVFLFRRVRDGFRLELHSTLRMEVAAGGEGPEAFLAVFDGRRPTPWLVAQRPLRFAAGETPDELYANGADRREALRWNPALGRFDTSSIDDATWASIDVLSRPRR